MAAIMSNFINLQEQSCLPSGYSMHDSRLKSLTMFAATDIVEDFFSNSLDLLEQALDEYINGVHILDVSQMYVYVIGEKIHGMN